MKTTIAHSTDKTVRKQNSGEFRPKQPKSADITHSDNIHDGFGVMLVTDRDGAGRRPERRQDDHGEQTGV